MFNTEDYELRHEALSKKIQTLKHFDASVEEALALHSLLHSLELSGRKPSFEDEIRDGLSDTQARAFVEVNTPALKLSLKRAFIKESCTIVWHIWHITRIEDIVGNLLIDNSAQVYNGEWQAKLCNSITDTGNALTAAAMAGFSNKIHIDTLWAYRNAVGLRTREILGRLKKGDMKRKPAAESLERLFVEGGLTQDAKSAWLADFWGKKTFGGLVLLPLTRHHLMHLRVCRELRKLSS